MKASFSVLAAVAVLAACSRAKAETLKPDATGGSWLDTTKWVEGTYPDGVGATATIHTTSPATPPANKTITLDSGITLGSIIVDTNNVAGPPALTASITVTVSNGTVPTSNADYNGDGVIDAADYVVWRKDPASFGGGDPAGYDLWRAQYGRKTTLGLTFDAPGAGPATITAPEGDGNGRLLISAKMTLNDNLLIQEDETIGTNFAGAVRLSGAISGPFGITKNGEGLLNFEGATASNNAKTYTGPTVINGGRFRILASNAPTASSSFTINGTTALELSSDGTFSLGAGTLTLNTTGLGDSANGTIRPDRTATLGRTLTITNPIFLQTNSVVHSQTASDQSKPTQLFYGDGSITLSGAISGPGQLTFTLPNSNTQIGSYEVTKANTYTGGTVLTGGLLRLADPNAKLGTGNVTIAAGAVGNLTTRLLISAGVLDAIDNSATLSIATGFTTADPTVSKNIVELGSGISESIARLFLNGVPQAAGTYGSTSSGATFQDNTYFDGTGVLNVLVGGAGSGSAAAGAVPEPATISLVGLFLSFVSFSRRGRRIAVSS